MEIHSQAGTLPPIPDDLTVPQFILDGHHPTRPLRPEGVPWLIEDKTGQKIGFEEVSFRVIEGFCLEEGVKESLTLFGTKQVESRLDIPFPKRNLPIDNPTFSIARAVTSIRFSSLL